jgi:hypothetical protein
VSNVERKQQGRPRNGGNLRGSSNDHAAEIERLLAMVAERDQALAVLEGARLDAQSYESALKARIAELKAQVAGLAPPTGRRRTSARGKDWPPIRLYDESLVARLADLLERSGPQFIAAARRHVALTKVEAAARAAARVKAKAAAATRKPTTKTTKRRKARAT